MLFQLGSATTGRLASGAGEREGSLSQVPTMAESMLAPHGVLLEQVRPTRPYVPELTTGGQLLDL